MSLFNGETRKSKEINQQVVDTSSNVASTFAERLIGKDPLPYSLSIEDAIPNGVAPIRFANQVSATVDETLSVFPPTSGIVEANRLVPMPNDTGTTIIFDRTA